MRHLIKSRGEFAECIVAEVNVLIRREYAPIRVTHYTSGPGRSLTLAWRLDARPLRCVYVVLHLDRSEGISEHLFFEFAVGHRKAIMLSFMFGPRIDFETLEVGI